MQKNICAEKRCEVNLAEDGALAIYCDVCSGLFCIKCMGIHHMQGTKTVYYLLYIIEEYTFHGGLCFHFFNIMKEN